MGGIRPPFYVQSWASSGVATMPGKTALYLNTTSNSECTRKRCIVVAEGLLGPRPSPRPWASVDGEPESSCRCVSWEVPNPANRSSVSPKSHPWRCRITSTAPSNRPHQIGSGLGGNITYVRGTGQWAYLAVVLDLYARRVGGEVSETPDTALVLKAIERAVETRQPERGLLFHPDQGVQYRSHGYQHYLKQYQISPSMSRKGKCWDNAPMERLFRSLRTEWIPRHGYRSLPETSRDVGEYLMGYYNRGLLNTMVNKSSR